MMKFGRNLRLTEKEISFKVWVVKVRLPVPPLGHRAMRCNLSGPSDRL